jgi:cellulose synthase/poly-beta-1,6-N-acetylglucosamine synthase-like glycosyltransferase
MPSQLTDYRKISLALIATVFNEKNNIKTLLNSYQQQSVLAKEFIIVDAESTDGTNLIIAEFAQKNPHLNIRLFRKKSNRSQARNFAVKQTQADYLAFTDAGCRLDQFWLEELLKKLLESKARVVGGYFRGVAHSRFEEAIVPYFLQLTKNVHEKNFMPTTRSLLIEKKLWQELGGLNEKLTLSEDYQLMLRIKQRKWKIAFAPKAVLEWEPPHNLRDFIKKIAAFAKSDIEAGIIRPKVLLIFARYFCFLILCLYLNIFYFVALFALYLVWSIAKNQHNCPKAWYLLPFIQVITDLVIMTSTVSALPNFSLKADRRLLNF